VRKIRTRKDEEEIYNSQDEEMEKKYGKEAADNANSGWFVDDYCICTKVYGYGVLTSYYVGNKIIHEWEDR